MRAQAFSHNPQPYGSRGKERPKRLNFSPDNRDLPLGKAYAVLFGGRGFEVGFFVPERKNEHTFN